jgi:hypothetical protein
LFRGLEIDAEEAYSVRTEPEGVRGKTMKTVRDIFGRIEEAKRGNVAMIADTPAEVDAWFLKNTLKVGQLVRVWNGKGLQDYFDGKVTDANLWPDPEKGSHGVSREGITGVSSRKDVYSLALQGEPSCEGEPRTLEIRVNGVPRSDKVSARFGKGGGSGQVFKIGTLKSVQESAPRTVSDMLDEAEGKKKLSASSIAPHVEKFKKKFTDKGWDVVKTKVSAKGSEVTMRFELDAARAFVVRLRPTDEAGVLEGDVRLMDYDEAQSTSEFEVSDLANTKYPLSGVSVPRPDGK